MKTISKMGPPNIIINYDSVKWGDSNVWVVYSVEVGKLDDTLDVKIRFRSIETPICADDPIHQCVLSYIQNETFSSHMPLGEYLQRMLGDPDVGSI